MTKRYKESCEEQRREASGLGRLLEEVKFELDVKE